MLKEQFDQLMVEEHLFQASDLHDKSDRTLLYGYTCSRSTFHVYMKNQEIHTLIYKRGLDNKPVDLRERTVTCNREYLPDKRLYPETCDYEFCKLLKDAGYNLPFTCWDNEREEDVFYGYTLEEA